MKKILFIAMVAVAVYLGYGKSDEHRLPAQTTAPISRPESPGASDAVLIAVQDWKSGDQVTGEGIVTKVLSDDDDGSRHQRFILRLPSGQTVLVAHNIDLAPRVASLKSGDTVEFNGVYEWNAKGGVVHWTHRDPEGRHEAGWLRHGGATYQ